MTEGRKVDPVNVLSPALLNDRVDALRIRAPRVGPDGERPPGRHFRRRPTFRPSVLPSHQHQALSVRLEARPLQRQIREPLPVRGVAWRVVGAAAGRERPRAGHLMSLVTSSALPSGSHTGSNTPSGRVVTWRASPPASESTQSCPPCCRVDTNASVFPSGDQRGWRSEPGPAVSSRPCPVATSASQMRVVPRLSLSDCSVTVYATHFPSGESCGSPTDLRAM